MVNEEQPPQQTQQPENLDAIKNKSSQVDALQNQLGNILSGVEKSLAVTCESIMGKMKQLEDKIQDMEKRYTELAKDAEQTLKEVDKNELKSESETTSSQVAGGEAQTTSTTTTTTTTQTATSESSNEAESKQQQ